MNTRKIRAKVFLSILLMWPFMSESQTVLTFDNAMEIAMENSPTVVRAKLDLERSRENLNAQQASLKSRFSLAVRPVDFSTRKTFIENFATWRHTQSTSSSGVFTISQPVILTDGTISLNNSFNWQDSQSEYLGDRSTDRSFTNNLYLSYQQPLFTYNRQKMALRELEIALETTELDYALQKLSVERQVTQSFYNLYRSVATALIAEEELKNQELSYEIIKARVEAGLVPRVQQYQSEINIANSRLSYQNTIVSLEQSFDSFKALIGLPLEEEITIDTDIDHNPVHVDARLAIEYGIQNSTTLRQQRVSLENLHNNLIRTRAQNEFSGNLTLTYGILGNDELFRDVYSDPTRNQSVGIRFDIPIFDWGANESRVKAVETGITRQKVTMEEQKNTITRNIRQICRELENAAAQIEIAEQNIKLAELTYEIHLEEYRNGKLTSMDLSRYQQQLSSSRLEHISRLISYKLSLLDLKIQTLWDFEKNIPVHLD